MEIEKNVYFCSFAAFCGNSVFVRAESCGCVWPKGRDLPIRQVCRGEQKALEKE